MRHRDCATAPSTGGTLIAFALMAAAKATVDPGAPSLARAAAYLDAAAASIAQRGQVERGDRTMLDALGPAAEAVHAAVPRQRAATAARDAATAADEGAAATATMAAKVGRAGWLAERAAGHEDAGARLVALAFARLAALTRDACPVSNARDLSSSTGTGTRRRIVALASPRRTRRPASGSSTSRAVTSSTERPLPTTRRSSLRRLKDRRSLARGEERLG